MWAITMFAISRTFGKERKGGTDAPEWTEGVTIEQLAQFAACDVRTAQRTVEQLSDGKILAVRRPKKGWLVFKPLPAGWRALPNYTAERKPPQLELDTAGDGPDRAEPEADAAVNREIRRLTRQPVRVEPGHRSKTVPITCGVKSIEWSVDTHTAMLYEIVVQPGGALFLTGKPADGEGVGIRPKNTRSNGFNGLRDAPRQICRGEGPDVDRNGPAKARSVRSGSARGVAPPGPAARSVRLDELSAGLAQREIAQARPRLDSILQQIPDVPISQYLDKLDESLARCKAKGVRFQSVWLTSTIALDARGAWEEKQRAGDAGVPAPKQDDFWERQIRRNREQKEKSRR